MFTVNIVATALLIAASLIASDTFAQERSQSAQRSSTVAAPRKGQWQYIVEKRSVGIHRSNDRVVIIGDSIAGRFPSFVQEEVFGYTFINIGVGGDRTENLLWRLAKFDLRNSRPRAIILYIGTNNLRAKDSADDTVAGILLTIDTIRSQVPRTTLIVSEILPMGNEFSFRPNDIAVVNAALAAAQESHEFQLLNVHNSISEAAGYDAKPPIYADWAHLDADGYRVMSMSLKKMLQKQ